MMDRLSSMLHAVGCWLLQLQKAVVSALDGLRTRLRGLASMVQFPADIQSLNLLAQSTALVSERNSSMRTSRSSSRRARLAIPGRRGVEQGALRLPKSGEPCCIYAVCSLGSPTQEALKRFAGSRQTSFEFSLVAIGPGARRKSRKLSCAPAPILGRQRSAPGVLASGIL